MRRVATLAGMWGLVLACASGVQAEVVIDTVTVGNPGNTPDNRYQTPGCGGVGYVYSIGKYEVTTGQYVEFLNAVAQIDTYGLYNSNMNGAVYGCQITQHGTSGSYWYDLSGRPSGTEADWAGRPVNYVGWGDAARFANWMHNGQGAGDTETGSYDLNGAMTNAELLTITREPGATWVIPSDDEWYKSAYHKNDGATGNYFDHPTSSNSMPSNDLVEPTDPGNNATFYGGDPPGYTIGGPYYRTEVGAHENSESPYNTLDQAGNVWEWNEAILYGAYRGMRGGSIDSGGSSLHASVAGFGAAPPFEYGAVGFRIAFVPELVIGDLNCDGRLDNGDIDAFVFALSYPDQYPDEFPACDIALGDINGDGWMNNGDIDAFVALLGG